MRGRKQVPESQRENCVGLKFIPVRGWKRVAVVKECLSAGVEIYPREGTETAESRPRRTARVEIYPREGTETASGRRRESAYLVEIYPREGTETV